MGQGTVSQVREQHMGQGIALGPHGSHTWAVLRLETGNTFHLTLCLVLQTTGGAAGDHEAERDGEWPFPVSALWGGAGLPGKFISVLQRL